MEPAPRINKALMPQYLGRTVRLVAKVSAPPDRNQDAQVESSDGERVTVHQANPGNYSNAFIEVIGKVNNDGSVTEYTSSSFGNDFNLPNYNEMILLAHMHQEIFIK
eukprot:TRINITY_DN715_c0_g2_i1.p1 TRINITY_DN715_c0_g2~~TRINITY_DN715_c0_g2_i1.p1  ORF type:complete len:121 (+),score=54.76 TRINITY_DN715_c0_g2_i1:45-365(+)